MSSAQQDNARAPLVSVGIPVYNGSRYIREALDSVLAQTLSDFELIVADNHSTDSTEDICRDYARRDPRIRYIRHDRNCGLLANFAFVAQQARGQFFTWLAYDDALGPDYLEKIVPFLSRHDQLAIAANDFMIIDQTGKELRIDKLDLVRESIPWEDRRVPFFEYGYRNIHLCFYGLTHTALCKRIMAEARPPKMADGVEYPVLARFAAAGEIVAVPLVLRKYRSHSSGNYLAEVAKRNEKKWRGVYFFYSNLFKMRVELFSILVRSPLPLASKLRILRRHMILDFRWYLYKIGQTLHIHRD